MVPVQRGSAVVMVDTSGKGPTQRQLANEREKNAKMTWKGVQEMTELLITHPDVSLLPFPVNDVILHTLSLKLLAFFRTGYVIPERSWHESAPFKNHGGVTCSHVPNDVNV